MLRSVLQSRPFQVKSYVYLTAFRIPESRLFRDFKVHVMHILLNRDSRVPHMAILYRNGSVEELSVETTARDENYEIFALKFNPAFGTRASASIAICTVAEKHHLPFAASFILLRCLCSTFQVHSMHYQKHRDINASLNSYNV